MDGMGLVGDIELMSQDLVEDQTLEPSMAEFLVPSKQN
jgi:hypothetical protein